MAIPINLLHNNGFKWFEKHNVFFKGFFYYQNNYFTGFRAVDLLKKSRNYQEFKTFVSEINGLFSIIIKLNNKTLIVSDRTRTFPLFYSVEPTICISDNPLGLGKKTIAKAHAKTFLQTGFTTGNTTLVDQVYQTQASEIVTFTDNRISSENYYSYETNSEFDHTNAALRNNLGELLKLVFANFLKSLENKHVALSLSGGYDSRLIAVMLKQLNYKEVTCFTYGRPDNNPETEISAKVAQQLGFKWLFIPYTREMAQNYLHTSNFEAYVSFAAKMSSMPYLQDYFAIKHLKDENLVPKNCIFVNGHSGDFLAGSHLRNRIGKQDNPKKIASLIFQNNFNLSFYPNKYATIDEIYEKIRKSENYAYSIFENWDLRERQAKFIVNSSSVYDHFGYQFRMPLWDYRLMDFFRKVPLKYKNQKQLYDAVLQQLFKQYDLNYEYELQTTNLDIIWQNLKDKLKRKLPTNWLKKLSKKEALPWHAYDILTAPMLAEIKNTEYYKYLSKNYNAVICAWYINFVQQKIKNEDKN